MWTILGSVVACGWLFVDRFMNPQNQHASQKEEESIDKCYDRLDDANSKIHSLQRELESARSYKTHLEDCKLDRIRLEEQLKTEKEMRKLKG